MPELNLLSLVNMHSEEFLRCAKDGFGETKTHACTALWHTLDILGRLDQSQLFFMARYLPGYTMHLFGRSLGVQTMEARKKIQAQMKTDMLQSHESAYWQRHRQHVEFVERNQHSEEARRLTKDATAGLLSRLALMPGLEAGQDSGGLGIDAVSHDGRFRISHHIDLSKPFEISLHATISTPDGRVFCPGYNYYSGMGLGPTGFHYHTQAEWEKVEVLVMGVVARVRELFA